MRLLIILAMLAWLLPARAAVPIGDELKTGPSLDLLLEASLNESEARIDAELVYESGSGRVIARRSGASADGSVPIQIEQQLIYGNVLDPALSPWPTRITDFELVPGQEGLEQTSATDLTHDVLGRVVRSQSSDGRLEMTTYDRDGPAIRHETGTGKLTSWLRDARGLVVREHRPEGQGGTSFAYELDGRLLRRDATTAAGDVWSTVNTYDSAGRLAGIDHHDGSYQTFSYYGDDTLASWRTRDGIVLEHLYDAANRLQERTPSLEGVLPPNLQPLDGGDSYQYDTISRVLLVDRPGVSGVGVATTGYDLASRPLGEQVGGRSALGWSYDAFHRTTRLDLPAGLGASLKPIGGFDRTYDTLDRLNQVSTPMAFGASWSWGGANRLYGLTTHGPLEVAYRYGYHDGAGMPGDVASDPDAEWKLGAITVGSAKDATGSVVDALPVDQSWAGFGLGYRSSREGTPADGLKIGRTVRDLDLGLFESMGRSWGYDQATRLAEATHGIGSMDGEHRIDDLRWTYGFGEGDELESVTTPSGLHRFTTGADGRILTRDGEVLDYDESGRRTSDDRAGFVWDWRTRLYEVEISATSDHPFAGHKVEYEYDASGRLLWRIHWSPEDEAGERGFIEKREFVWEGSALVQEHAYNVDESWRWSKTYLPGPGLDDAVMVRIETATSDRTFTYLRDEMGTVIGLVEETADADPRAPPIVARYYYDPYGQAALGPVTGAVDLKSLEYETAAAAFDTAGGALPGGQSFLLHGAWFDPATGYGYFRNRWYDPRTLSWLSEDPLGPVDSPNLYQAFGYGPHSSVDPTGESVYLVYRQFNGRVLKAGYGAIGHYYLAFTDERLEDVEQWNFVVEVNGTQDLPPRDVNPAMEMFSFHPWQVRTLVDPVTRLDVNDESQSVFLDTVITNGTYVGYNDEVDQDAAWRGIGNLERFGAARVLTDREVVWNLGMNQEEQEEFYLNLIASRNINNSGPRETDFGRYLLFLRNCGSWAKWQLEQVGGEWPTLAYLGNGGQGVDGPVDWPLAALSAISNSFSTQGERPDVVPGTYPAFWGTVVVNEDGTVEAFQNGQRENGQGDEGGGDDQVARCSWGGCRQ